MSEIRAFGLRVLVVGTGLIGASIAMALSRAGVPVWLQDLDPDSERIAAQRSYGMRRGEHPDLDPNLVVVAVPPAALAETISKALVDFPNAVVTDVGSVKGQVIGALRAAGADLSRFAGGHPMAGREVSGAAASRGDLFDDRVWVVTPVEETAPASVERVKDLIELCHAVPFVMPADEHDRAVAVTSHTPQLLSSALAARLADMDPAHVAISGQGLADMTRIAGSDPNLWSEIIEANSAQVADVLEALVADLSDVLVRLRDSDGADAVRQIVGRGRDGREHVPGKHGSTTADRYSTVTVFVDDRPGVLARVFAVAGEAGVNLEDVRIEHHVGRQSALLDISVDPASADLLRATLRADGWDVRG